MLILIIGLLIIWVICVVLGLVIKTLLWLAIVGIVAFVLTIVGALVAHATK